jgi:RNA polymerase sigma-70 factor (ECF subfamily)
VTRAEGQWLAERFQEQRARLTPVARRMLGSAAEADDAVQETWLRLSRSDTASVDNLGARLTTVLSRVCLNALEQRRARRESPADGLIEAPLADLSALTLSRKRSSPTLSGWRSSSCSTP